MSAIGKLTAGSAKLAVAADGGGFVLAARPRLDRGSRFASRGCTGRATINLAVRRRS